MKRALLVIDVQNEYFTGKLPVSYPPGSLKNILAAIDASIKRDIPVVVVQHSAKTADSPVFRKETPEWELHQEIAKRPCSIVIEKNLPGSFTGTPLESWLKEKGIGTVTICGYMTQMCCDTTARQAFHLGFAVEFLSDATGTLSICNDAGSVTAEELHRAILVTQGMMFSKVMKTHEWLNGLESGTSRQMDDFLKERLLKYDQWLVSGKISFSSKVVPVGESLQAQQWVLPAEQVMNILRDARSIALQKCLCRVHYARCDKPLEVCLTLNEVGEKFVAKGLARPVSLSEAADVLHKADENGLVHLSLYIPDHKIAALCSCCSCCCHDIQLMKSFNRKDLMVRSEYVAATDMDKCVNCGDCVQRCVFSARNYTDGQMHYNADACLGCGLCVSVCPVQATVMQALSAP